MSVPPQCRALGVRPLVESRPPAVSWHPAPLSSVPPDQPALDLSEPEAVDLARPRDPGVRATVVRARWTARPRSGLPDAGEWSASLVLAVVQVLLAQRPIAQLNRWLADDVLCAVARQQRQRRADRARSVVRVVAGIGPGTASAPGRGGGGGPRRGGRIDHGPGPALGGQRRPVALYRPGAGSAGTSLGCDLHCKPRPESGDFHKSGYGVLVSRTDELNVEQVKQQVPGGEADKPTEIPREGLVPGRQARLGRGQSGPGAAVGGRRRLLRLPGHLPVADRDGADLRAGRPDRRRSPSRSVSSPLGCRKTSAS